MQLGKFEILEEVGHGGFGTVYRANDTTLDRIVALKVLHDQYNSDQKFIESFKREAKFMARITHPNVVQILEVGDLDGQIYIAMQYFDGGSLEQKITAGGPLPLKDAIRMLNQVARGLEAGHKIGLIHRDIKPANILYNQDGFIAISDFGVAKSIKQGSVETTSSFNQFAGSPYYIPPELWQSKGNLSPAADVYSLACVFYEALTGEILFLGNTYEHVLTRHVLEAPVFSKSLPENLVDLLSVALAKNPSDRYQTMNDFLMATRAALESKKTRTEKTESPGKADVINELPKPLAPGEITFDQLVRRSQGQTPPQRQTVKPVEQKPPVIPPIESRQPAADLQQKPIEPTLPAKEIAQPTVEVPPKPRSVPQPQPQPPTPGVKPGNVNFKPFTEVHPENTETPSIPPTPLPLAPEFQQASPTTQQFSDEGPDQVNPIPAPKTPKKKKIFIPILISSGVILLISLLIVFRNSIFPSPTEQITGNQTAQTQTATPLPTSVKFRIKDGMEMVFVPEGTFEMGSNTGDDDEKPVRQVNLDGYWIDKYEITNAQYAQCVSEGACSEPGSLSSYTRETYYGDVTYANYPVIHVTWYQAQEYCQWIGGNLPTEAQWEKTARGTDSREYPWGNETPDYSRANYDLSIGDTTAVGSYPSGASPYGAMDMAGNVWEWVRDGFDVYSPNETNNPTGPSDTVYRTIRGGNYFDLPSAIRSAYRFYGEPDLSGYDIGFRCILPPETSQVSATKIVQAKSTVRPSPTSEFHVGSTKVRELDGMEMVYVPEGSFEMGSTTGDEDEMPIHQVYLDAYWIDKYEVTNAQYALCVADGACSEPVNGSSASRGSYYGNPTYENYPVVWMKWSQANAYCQWAGADLPTEAQWEKAARGTDGREYPWGDDPPDETKGNYDFDRGNSTAVGFYPQSLSPYGALDMAGNVWEWVRDWYGPYDTDLINNPVGPDSGDVKVMRGGCWYNTTKNVRTSYRGGDDPNNSYYSYGFRCAVAP